ncbi:MAG: tRNA preQ1(34) S-adenosylmethionine ribosyltransferase-isomerase QueA [bacterium]
MKGVDLQTSDFNYDLPEQLIAQVAMEPRDHAGLLIMHRDSGAIEHKKFFDIKAYLKKGDIVVLNNTKVMPARLKGFKQTGGKVEVFLLRENEQEDSWQCLIAGLGKQKTILFSENARCDVLRDNNDGTFAVRFKLDHISFSEFVDKHGQVPLPPYIKKTASSDKERYQTVFAQDEKRASVAAPTAGLHFTDKLLAELRAQGVEFVEITLHVGLGTFASVKTEVIGEHKMHSERYEISSNVQEKIRAAKKAGRRVITVGTTATRAIESFFSIKNISKPQDFVGETDIFIYPSYRFQIVDGIITNFHVPKSTLLMLVSAFAQNNSDDNQLGLERIKNAYNEAIKRHYRFFSYGDAMLII